MAGITLETAKRHLDAWLEAELAVTNAQSYTIGSRTMTKANLTEIRKSIEYWQGKVTALENAAKYGGRNRAKRFVPRDKTLPVIARFGALFPPIARKNGVIL